MECVTYNNNSYQGKFSNTIVNIISSKHTYCYNTYIIQYSISSNILQVGSRQYFNIFRPNGICIIANDVNTIECVFE